MSLVISKTASIGIATGASVGVVIFFATIFYSLHRWRKRKDQRKHADVEKVKSPIGLPMALNEPCKPDITGRRSAHSPEAAWTIITSADDLPWVPRVSKDTSRSFYTAQQVQKPRSTLSKKRRSLRNSFPLKAVRPSHLSDIPESPKQDVASQRTASPQIQDSVSTRRRFQWARRSPSVRKSPVQEGGMISIDRSTPPGSPRPDVSPCRALKPEPLFSRRLSLRKSTFMDPDMACVTDRSRSVPSIIGPSGDRPLSNRSKSISHMRQRSRTISLCSQEPGNVPQQPPPPPPPPPPPTEASRKPSRPQIMIRKGSATSTSSVNTTSSSILVKDMASPSLQARTEFIQRNPDTQLGAHLRQGSGDVNDLWVSKPTANPRHRPHKRTKIQKPGSRSVPKKTLLPVFEAQAARSKSLHALQGHPPPPDLTSHIQKAVVTKLSPVPSRSGSLEIRMGALSALGKRRSQVWGASERGSPTERHKDSPLKAVSGNRPLLPRDDSQSSVDTSNPFHWDPTYVPEKKQPVKPSALKGSPSARNKNNRNTRVRISVQPTEIESAYASTSSNSLDEIAARNEGQRSRVQSWQSVAAHQRSMSKRESLRTVQGSPRLSLSQAHKDRIIARRPEFGLSARSATNNRESTASSNFTLSAFPEPSNAGFIFPFAQEQNPQANYPEPIETVNKALVPHALRPHSRGRISPEQMSPLRHRPNTSQRIKRMTSGHTDMDQEYGFEGGNMTNTTSQTSLPDEEKIRLTPAPLRSLSPPPKASPTIQISTPTAHDGRMTPLSSTVNPLNTKPELAPPYSDFKPSVNFPHGPRSAPPQTLLRCVQSLRRMDSEHLDMLHNHEATREEWRYLHIGREASPMLGSSPRDERSSPLAMRMSGDSDAWSNKENRPLSHGKGDSDDWTTGGLLETAAASAAPREGGSKVVLTPRSRNGWKKNATTSDWHARQRSSGDTVISLYDKDGFYVEHSP